MAQRSVQFQRIAVQGPILEDGECVSEKRIVNISEWTDSRKN